ncbi:MAG TPA: glycosyltransferase [Nitriliruptorales bacterium]|nr:glycosyltransferase [Nitriliruptorales bacterium]
MSRSVSVVVITMDRVEELCSTLRRLQALPERPRIVVADNGSSDGTSRVVAREFPDVRLIALDRNRGAAARNLGVAEVATPYVAFNDDDTWWEPGSLAAAARLLDAHPTIAVVNARIVVEPTGAVDAISEEMAASPLRLDLDLPGTALLSFLAGASVVRRDAFLEVGGFEPRLLIGGEEELLAADLAAAGWSMRYVPELVVHHHASTVRDPHLRRRQGIRNTLWFTWLRRRRPVARTLQLLRQFAADHRSARAVLAALGGLPWVLRERRPVPPHVEQGLRQLERQQADSTARQYVS